MAKWVKCDIIWDEECDIYGDYHICNQDEGHGGKCLCMCGEEKNGKTGMRS
jgi:hypothetical protein